MISIASIFSNPVVAFFVDYIAINHRPLAVIFVVLPLSFALRCVFAFFERQQRALWPTIKVNPYGKPVAENSETLNEHKQVPACPRPGRCVPHQSSADLFSFLAAMNSHDCRELSG
jgi:hypothetical protein